MTKEEIDRIEALTKSIQDMNTEGVKMYARIASSLQAKDHKIDRILAVLEDDKNSSRLGLITEVNNLRDEVDDVQTVVRRLKNLGIAISSFVMAILTSVSIFIIKRFFE